MAQCLNRAAGASRSAYRFPLGRLHAIKSVSVHAHCASRNLYDFLDLQLGALEPCRQLGAIVAAYTASKPLSAQHASHEAHFPLAGKGGPSRSFSWLRQRLPYGCSPCKSMPARGCVGIAVLSASEEMRLVLEGHCLLLGPSATHLRSVCTMSDVPLHRSVSPLQQLQRPARGQSIILQLGSTYC